MTRIPAYILAGGRSSRFGSDKARAIYHGRPLIQHVADLLSPVATEITVVADQNDKYQALGLRTICDLNPGRGPLAGLHAALTDLPVSDPWLLLCSCDAIVIRRPWLERLTNQINDPYQAIAFRSERWQPLPGLYARNALPHVERILDSDNRSMQRLLDHLDTAAVALPADWPEHWQVNSPADLLQHRDQQGPIAPD